MYRISKVGFIRLTREVMSTYQHVLCAGYFRRYLEFKQTIYDFLLLKHTPIRTIVYEKVSANSLNGRFPVQRPFRFAALQSSK